MSNVNECVMKLLARQAEYLVFALSHAESGRILLLPVEDHGSPVFEAALRGSMGQGFAPLGIVALCSTADGQPLIEDETLDGVSAASMQPARQAFAERLIETGVLKPDTPVA